MGDVCHSASLSPKYLYWLLGTSVQEKTDLACPITRIPGHGTRLRDTGNLFFSLPERGKLKEARTTDTFCQQALRKTIWMPSEGSSFEGILTLSCMVVSDGSSLRHLSVVMVQPSQDRNSNHLCCFVQSRTR